jgi:hypothetical protein
MAIDTKKAIWDYGMNANMDSNYNLIIYENEDAINNALKTFFYTGESEILNQPFSGGALVPYMFKPLNVDTYKELLFFIRVKIDTEFSPAVTPLEIKILPEFDQRKWDITIKYYIEQFNVEETLQIALARVQIRKPAEEIKIISLTGQKLYNFIVAYLYEMFGISIKWNGTQYQWGERFLFTALTPEDVYYDRIMELVNSNR